MEILATFPAVRVDGLPVPAETEQPTPAPGPATHPGRRGGPGPVRAGPRLPPWSVTILGVVAAAVWLTVWAVERTRCTPSAATAHTAAISDPAGQVISR